LDWATLGDEEIQTAIKKEYKKKLLEGVTSYFLFLGLFLVMNKHENETRMQAKI